MAFNIFVKDWTSIFLLNFYVLLDETQHIAQWYSYYFSHGFRVKSKRVCFFQFSIFLCPSAILNHGTHSFFWTLFCTSFFYSPIFQLQIYEWFNLLNSLVFLSNPTSMLFFWTFFGPMNFTGMTIWTSYTLRPTIEWKL